MSCLGDWGKGLGYASGQHSHKLSLRALETIKIRCSISGGDICRTCDLGLGCHSNASAPLISARTESISDALGNVDYATTDRNARTSAMR